MLLILCTTDAKDRSNSYLARFGVLLKKVVLHFWEDVCDAVPIWTFEAISHYQLLDFLLSRRSAFHPKPNIREPNLSGYVLLRVVGLAFLLVGDPVHQFRELEMRKVRILFIQLENFSVLFRSRFPLHSNSDIKNYGLVLISLRIYYPPLPPSKDILN